MINLAISVPGNFYRDAITKALEKTGDFRVRALQEYGFGAPEGSQATGTMEKANGFGAPGGSQATGTMEKANGFGTPKASGPPTPEYPEVALLGVSVHQGFTLKERRFEIQSIRNRAPDCKIVLFLDELVSPEQTEGVKNLKQARLIDGFLYASGTMEYLVATLESV